MLISVRWSRLVGCWVGLYYSLGLGVRRVDDCICIDYGDLELIYEFFWFSGSWKV